MANDEETLDMKAYFSSTTVTDVEFDIIQELKNTLEDMGKSLEEQDLDSVKSHLPYLGFLVNDLESALTGEYENLRYRRIISKKTD